jgi:hypothetical protein
MRIVAGLLVLVFFGFGEEARSVYARFLRILGMRCVSDRGQSVPAGSGPVTKIDLAEPARFVKSRWAWSFLPLLTGIQVGYKYQHLPTRRRLAGETKHIHWTLQNDRCSRRRREGYRHKRFPSGGNCLAIFQDTRVCCSRNLSSLSSFQYFPFVRLRVHRSDC